MADIVLPATMFMRSTTISITAAATQHISVGPKLIDLPGECRSNHEVLQDPRPPPHRGASRIRDVAWTRSTPAAQEERARRYRHAGSRSVARHPARFLHCGITLTVRARRQEVPLKADWANLPFGNPGLGTLTEMPSLPDH